MWWVRVAGTYNLFWGLSHVAYLYTWRRNPLWEQIPVPAAAVLDIFNVQVAIVFLLVAFLYFFLGREVLSTRLGAALNVGMALFWLFRAGDEVVVRWYPSALTLFGLGAALHIGVLWRQRRVVPTVGI